jgi:hypothetical protein
VHELGYWVSPTVIAKLDSGHRGDVLSVAELVVLAAALDTAPITLLYPGPYDDTEQGRICSASETEVIPRVKFGDYLASQWFSALLPWTEDSMDQGKLPKSRRTYARNVRALRKAREIAELHAGLVARAIPESGESVEDFLALNDRARQRIAELRSELADLQSEGNSND